MKHILLFIFSFLTLLNKPLFGQDTNGTHENIDILRQNGQIYLVVLVLVTIFAGILWMLIRIERKLVQLESEKKH